MYELIHRIPHAPWKKPSENEQKYFRRQELEKRAQEARRRREEQKRRERERLAEAHRDHCPDCGILLEPMALPDGEARRCPECRGVWLDREVFQALAPQEDRQEALGEIFRAMMSFSLGGIPEMVQGGEAPDGPQ